MAEITIDQAEYDEMQTALSEHGLNAAMLETQIKNLQSQLVGAAISLEKAKELITLNYGYGDISARAIFAEVNDALRVIARLIDKQ